MGKTRHIIGKGDVRRILNKLGDGTVHLVVTSPPYPMIKLWDDLFGRLDPEISGLYKSLGEIEQQYSERGEKLVSEIYVRMHECLRPVWEQIYRVLADGGIACINIGDATRKINGVFRLFPNHAVLLNIFTELGFITLPYILWKKPTNKPNAFLGSGFLPTNAYVTHDVEYILIFRKGGPRKFPKHDPMRYASRYTKEERDKWFSQIWEDIRGERQTDRNISRRTAAFPEEIPLRLIRMFSVKGDTVLDPFLGTGTTVKAAMKTDRNSIGYEIEEEIFESIVNTLTVLADNYGCELEIER